MALITCQDASFAYEGTVAVSGLNFEVQSGDYLCIVGENGSGKSTLLKGLLRLKQPCAGSVLMGDTRSPGGGLKATEIGYLPQQTAAQKDFPASAYEVILSGRLSARGILPFYSRRDKAVAEENIMRLGVGSLRHRCYRELSGGQQQRVLLARALCSTKKVLLLDEPVSGLDPVVTQELYRLIEQINRDTGLTVIMVSHDVQSAVKYASHILHLRNTQVFFGKAEDYLQTDAGKVFAGQSPSGGKVGETDD
ncbi:MAG: metal ABC transporter ATP-binding protein [Oscillospiraceae bacterium]|jgi:zinc transport system ATP-binding protein|nr:metal ABC transporter ATP-binding protein [Oscillospiraceae bacterium]